MSTHQELESAIAALEAQRALLGDDVVDLAIAPLRQQLDAMRDEAWTSGGQRLKQVTVLFTDVVGSTSMARELDPEDIHAIMDGALERLTGIVNDNGGRVLQYAGDSLLAAFGAEVSREDDPENAIRTGLAFLEATPELAEAVEKMHGLRGFNIRVGINTGRVLLGGGVDAENSIRGITVNVAARMEQNAPPGGLRISHDTYRHVRGVFDVEEKPPIQVKGLKQPMRSYLVRGKKPRAFRIAARTIDGLETPMIGRQAELLALQSEFHSVCEGQIPDAGARAVTVVGDAGLGKSRLLQEFESWSEAQPAAYYLFKGSSQPRTRRQPYGLLRDILAWRLQIADSDSAEVSREKLARQLSPLFGEDAPGQVELLGHLIGLDYSASPNLRGVLDDPQQIRSRGFHAAAQMLRRLTHADGLPSLILLDDLHWADADSLDFLSYLLQVNADVPMLLVAFTRPELYYRRLSWPSVDAAAIRIDLDTLDDATCRDLADELLSRLGDVPAALQEMLTTKAAGNPYYMEELVRVLLDDGVIVSELDRWRLVSDRLLSMRVPDTLTGLLQARMDRLSAAQRIVLQQAAVVGFVFWDSALAALGEDPAPALWALVQREFIVVRSQSAFEGAREYAFRHHVLHQVAYDTVLKGERQRYHLGVAKWLTSRVGERGNEYLGATAEHYERAGETATAVRRYADAAEHAASRHGCDATRQYVERALVLAAPNDNAVRWRLIAARERILATQDDRREHDDDLDALQSIADALGDDLLKAQALLRRATAQRHAGHYPEAEQTCRDALRYGRSANAVEIGSQACVIRAFALRRMGEFARAEAIVREGLALAQESGDRAIEGELLSNLAGLAAERGDLIEGRMLERRYLEISRETGDVAREIDALNMLGDNAFRLGDYSTARQRFDDGLRRSRSIGHRYGECLVLLNLALVANLQGDNVAAIDFARDAIAIASKSGLRDLEAAAFLPLGLALGEERRFDDARRALTRSRDLFRENAGEHLALEAVAGLASIALAQEDLPAAMRYVDVVLAHLDAGGSLDGTEEPLRIQWTCCDVLAHAADSRADAMISETRRQLLERANRISDEHIRHKFMHNVPHNRSIMRAAGAKPV